MARHRLVRRRRPDPVAVEVLVHVEPLGGLGERGRRRDEVVAGRRLREQARRAHRRARRDRLQERRRLDDLHRAEPVGHGDDVVLANERVQLGDAVAVVADQRRPARRHAAAARRAERDLALRRDRAQPRLLGPAVRELVARHPLDVGGVERQQLLLAQHLLVRGLADDVVVGPGGGVGVDEGARLGHRRERAVASGDEARQHVGPARQLRRRRLAERAGEEVGRAGDAPAADDAEQPPGPRHHALAGDDERRALLEAGDDVVPGAVDVGLARVVAADDRQVQELHEQRVDEAQARPGVVLAVALANDELVERGIELGAQQPAHRWRRRASSRRRAIASTSAFQARRRAIRAARAASLAIASLPSAPGRPSEVAAIGSSAAMASM